jgi:hypothetical protein
MGILVGKIGEKCFFVGESVKIGSKLYHGKIHW